MEVDSPVSTNRSVQSLSSGDFGDVSSMSRSLSGGLHRSVTRSRSSEQQQNVADVGEVERSSITPVTVAECSRAASSDGVTNITPEFDQRRSSVLSSRPDSGGRMSTTSYGRQRSSSSLFSESSVDACRSDRASAASTDQQRTSSSDCASLFRLPFPQPKRATKRSSSVGSVTAGQSPQRPSRFDL